VHMFFELVQNMKQVVDFNCYRRGGRAVECTGLEIHRLTY
jgi:hypothetical protein